MAAEASGEIIQECNTENLKKQLINLFPSRNECSYVSCYCEENVYKLCEDVSKRYPDELNKCYVTFISNQGRIVPLWKQRGGKDDDKLVIWDYHVIFIYQPDPDTCLVYDLDSELPFPTYFHKYVTETFRTDNILKTEYYRYFRVVPASFYLKDFTSDRRHMKRSDGSWIKTPPSYPPIISEGQTHNLEVYLTMDVLVGPGLVMGLNVFVKHFRKPET